MKTYEEINARIESGKAVVLTAEEIIDYVDRKGLAEAAGGGGRGHHGHLRGHVLVRLLPELRAQHAAHPHHRGLDRRRAGVQRGGRGGRLPGGHPAAAQRPGQPGLPRAVPLRRRARHREAGGRRAAAAVRPLLRHRRLPPPRAAHHLHHPRPEPGHHGQPAQLLPELQRGHQPLRAPHLHLPGAAAPRDAEPHLLLGGAALAAAQRPLLRDDRHRHAGLAGRSPGARLRRGHPARPHLRPRARTGCRARGRAPWRSPPT